MFVHLRAYSDYSRLKSLLKPADIVHAAKSRGMDAAGLTDFGTMAGLPEFQDAAKKAGIKPILGMTVNIFVDGNPYPVLLFAENGAGYANLLKIPEKGAGVSEIETYGLVAVAIVDHSRNFLEIASRFDRDSFFLTCGRRDLINTARRVAAETEFKIVASAPCAYEKDSDKTAFDHLAGLDQDSSFSATHYMTTEEMRGIYTHEECANAYALSRRLDAEIPLDVSRTRTNDGGALAAIARKNLGKLGERPEYAERLETELSVICGLGYADYFLLVRDIVMWARVHDVPVGPGRGSVCGSLVAYVLGVTEVDPVKYGLSFDRFLSVSRAEMPDIDLDFSCERHDDVLKYVSQKYGKERVARIATYARASAKTVLQELIGVAVRSLPDEVDLDSLEGYDAEKIAIAKKCTGLIRTRSTHPSGIVVSERPLVEKTALTTGPDMDAAVYPAKTLERLGLIKLDILSLKILDIIKKTRDILAEKGIFPPDRRRLAAENDLLVYELLGLGETKGVFQLDGDGQRKYLKRIVPSSFEDIVAFTALYRPGPLKSGLVETYIENRTNACAGDFSYLDSLDPVLVPILKPTYGIPIYQEQIVEIAMAIAGFSGEAADAFRHAVSKKDMFQMDRLEEAFVSGAVGLGHKRADACALFEKIAGFAEYGFNRSHSVGYAYLIFETAYFAAHYKREFARAWNYVDGDASPFRNTDSGFLSRIKGIDPDTAEFVENQAKAGPFVSLPDFFARVSYRKIRRGEFELLVRSGYLDSLKGKWSRRGLLVAGMSYYLDLARGADPEIIEREDLYVEWSKDELLRNEKLCFGMYLSENPLAAYPIGATTLLREKLAKLMDVPQSNVYFPAHIENVRKYTSKRTGRDYIRLAIDDLSLPEGCVGLIWNIETLDEIVWKIVYTKKGICKVRGYFKEDETFVITDIGLIK